jgi:hypothetical protein
MILPNKYTREDEALIGVGAVLLKHLASRISLSSLWEKVKDQDNIGNFERFILSLDLLFILGLISIENNEITRATS